MRTFSCFVTDDRYSVPTLTFLLVADAALARELALRRLLESPHHRIPDLGFINYQRSAGIGH